MKYEYSLIFAHFASEILYVGYSKEDMKIYVAYDFPFPNVSASGFLSYSEWKFFSFVEISCSKM